MDGARVKFSPIVKTRAERNQSLPREVANQSPKTIKQMPPPIETEPEKQIMWPSQHNVESQQYSPRRQDLPPANKFTASFDYRPPQKVDLNMNRFRDQLTRL